MRSSESEGVWVDVLVLADIVLLLVLLGILWEWPSGNLSLDWGVGTSLPLRAGLNVWESSLVNIVVHVFVGCDVLGLSERWPSDFLLSWPVGDFWFGWSLVWSGELLVDAVVWRWTVGLGQRSSSNVSSWSWGGLCLGGVLNWSSLNLRGVSGWSSLYSGDILDWGSLSGSPLREWPVLNLSGSWMGVTS